MNQNHPQPIASPRNELRNLRNNSQATIEELKSFLREMKGRSPQEMLGMVAGNRLFRATIQSCVLVFLVLLVFTAIPYVMREAPKAPVVKESVASPAHEKAAEPVVPNDPPAPNPKAIETLGVGEEKKAPADVNPLDSDTKDFLDELE